MIIKSKNNPHEFSDKPILPMYNICTNPLPSAPNNTRKFSTTNYLTLYNYYTNQKRINETSLSMENA